jgi:hypothetical protein
MLELKVLMVGPRGVGKTTLLASTYQKLEDELEKKDYKITRDNPTAAFLNKRVHEIKLIIKGKLKAKPSQGPQSTMQERDFKFDINILGGQDSDIRLTFIDIPGGWYTGEEGHEKADKLFEESHFAFVAIDANALMEDDGDYNDIINAPDTIYDSFKRTLNKGCLEAVVFTFVRAETYRDRTSELYETFYEEYQKTIDFCREQNVGVYATHVETVGGIQFNRFAGDENGIPTPEFIIVKEKGYQPANCEVPLQLILQHALQVSVNNLGSKVSDREKEVEDAENKKPFYNFLIPFETEADKRVKKAKDELNLSQSNLNKIEEELKDFSKSLDSTKFKDYSKFGVIK